MIAKFILCGMAKDILKHEGGLDNKGFYTATIVTKSSFDGKDRETFHKVTFFSAFLFDKLNKIKNNTLVTVEGKISTRKNEEKGFWEPSLNGTAIETVFSLPKTEQNDNQSQDEEDLF